MVEEVSGRALREPALVADATGAASGSAHSGDGQARKLKLSTIRPGDSGEVQMHRIALGMAVQRMREPWSSVETITISEREAATHRAWLLENAK